MPPDVTDRIMAALRAEATTRGEWPADDLAPVVPLPPKSAGRHGSTIPKPRRRSSPRSWLLPAAAVALIAAGGGYALQALRDSTSLGANSSVNSSGSSSESVADRASPGASPKPADSSSLASAPAKAAPDFTLESLAGQGRALLDENQSAAGGRQESGTPTAGLADPAQLRACADVLGAAPGAEVRVRTGTANRAPAALVIYSVVPGQHWVVNLVAPDCGVGGDAHRLAGPETIGTGTKTP